MRPPENDAIRDRGRFIKGQQYGPGTQFVAGDLRGVPYRFKTGAVSLTRMAIGSVRIRILTHSKKPRAWVKVAEPDVWRMRALVVWEHAHGPLPDGSVVHHKDRNSLNDELSNLAALTRKEHAREHQRELVIAAAKRLGLRVVEEELPA